MRLFQRVFPVFASVVLGASTVCAAGVSGLWSATVRVNEVEIPFRFEVAVQGGKVSGWFFNGDEQVRSTAGSFDGTALQLSFDHYATKLDVKLENGEMVGTYGRTTRPPYPFRARPYQAAADGPEAPSIAGQWDIAVKSPKGESAWKFLVRQSGAEVSATVLRIDGDTGTLSGRFDGTKFLLSHFSGARPSLWEVTPGKDGTLTVVQNKKSTYTAVRSSDARAKGLPEPADPSRWTSVKDPSQPLRFSAPDLTGKIVTESDPRFRGKVVLVNVTGSWCPNCHDEAPFLAELYRKYKSQGLEIVALSFEDTEQVADPTRLRAFIKQYGIDYTVLLAGETGDLSAKLPQAVNLNTWPATFFVGRDGLVRGSHAGFASRATGAEHEHLKAEFKATIEKLLAENIRSSRE